VSSLKDIHTLLDAAVRAGNAASDAIADHAADPFAVMLLQRIRLATAEYRKSRDELKVAMKQIARKEVPPLISNIAGEMKSQAAALKPVDIPLKRSRK
jgi:hypothetical protein